MGDIVERLENLHKKSKKEKSFIIARCAKDAVEEIKNLRYKLKEKNFYKKMSVDDLLDVIDALEDNKQALIRVRNRAAEDLCEN